MIRLLFVLALAALIAVAVTSLHAALRPPERPAPALFRTKEPAMPASLRTLSYALLLALMLGIVTGWIGG